ncbi:hypothetical protein CKO15_10825 [Halorhodospira abdelmalekii]|uniref:hypothetical protein n=1 Tax=Halorhodospira abdelmalekii TaxID=421629 RepID=UPI001904C739|nr:hypothetical protein [Halorhodospira abdelmalekii]MBK1735762.1 hypothetical protein [Halorhodospira abdelmalekii]
MTESVRSVVQGADHGLASVGRVPSLVEQVPVELKKLTVSSSGKLQIVLESEALSDEAIDKVRSLLTLQQGMVMASFDATLDGRFDA